MLKQKPNQKYIHLSRIVVKFNDFENNKIIKNDVIKKMHEIGHVEHFDLINEKILYIKFTPKSILIDRVNRIIEKYDISFEKIRIKEYLNILYDTRIQQK
jgi:hypothetical protein